MNLSDVTISRRHWRSSPRKAVAMQHKTPPPNTQSGASAKFRAVMLVLSKPFPLLRARFTTAGSPQKKHRRAAVEKPPRYGVWESWPSSALLRPSPSLLRCPVRRRALAGALETGQCAAASCRGVGSVVGVVASDQRAGGAQVEEGGLGGQTGLPSSAAGRRSAGWRCCLDRQFCVASRAGRTRPP